MPPHSWQCHSECQHKQYYGDGTSYQDCLRNQGFPFEDDKLKRGGCGRAHSYWISRAVGRWKADMSALQSSLLLWDRGEGGRDWASGRELVATAEALLDTHSSVPPMGLHINFYVVGFKWWIIQTYGEAACARVYFTSRPFLTFPINTNNISAKFICFFFVFVCSWVLRRKQKKIFFSQACSLWQCTHIRINSSHFSMAFRWLEWLCKLSNITQTCFVSGHLELTLSG